MKEKYKDLILQIESLIDPKCSVTGNLSNIASFIFHEIEDLNWVGYYLYEDGKLKLNTFQGKIACTILELNKGVCAKAARELQTIIVPNVHDFEGHIACDSASNSEIVVPILKEGRLYGVLDVDSSIFDRFDDDEKVLFETIVRRIEWMI